MAVWITRAGYSFALSPPVYYVSSLPGGIEMPERARPEGGSVGISNLTRNIKWWAGKRAGPASEE